jgi:shikimate dehydrogenase
MPATRFPGARIRDNLTAMNAPRPPGLTLCGSMSLHPVSLGAAMHLAGYRALGLPFTYVPFKVTDVAGALTGARALGIRGLGVSMPYKQTVVPLLDALDPFAARIGAVNTIVNDDGVLRGYNTDAEGAIRALEEAHAFTSTGASARVVLLGAGGAARAIAHALTTRGASVTLVNRDRDKAEALAHATGARVATLDAALEPSGFDVLVNATSLGMTDVDPRPPLPEALATTRLGPSVIVMDIVYKPIETEFLRLARRSGARVIHGGRMLLHQAARQFELYTGKTAPLDVMGDAMDDALRAPLGKAPATR